MTDRLAFVVPDLGPSQSSYLLIKNANQWVKTPGRDVLIFTEDMGPPCLPLEFARFQGADLAGYSGPVVATGFSQAGLALRSPSRSRVVVYLQDLEWMRTTRGYTEWRSVFASPLVTLAARSLDHAEAMNRAWGRPVSIVEAFDMAHLSQISRGAV